MGSEPRWDGYMICGRMDIRPERSLAFASSCVFISHGLYVLGLRKLLEWCTDWEDSQQR